MIFLKPKNNQKNEKFSYQKYVYVLQKIKFLASSSAESAFHFNFSLFHFISFHFKNVINTDILVQTSDFIKCILYSKV